MVNRGGRREGCSRCAQDMTSGTCGQLLQKLRTIDFSMIDTALYLDAYPDCTEAMEYYRKLNAERNKIITAMEAGNCAPVAAVDTANHQYWKWVEGPWPWEPEAN